jgi:hypothetical protein
MELSRGKNMFNDDDLMDEERKQKINDYLMNRYAGDDKKTLLAQNLASQNQLAANLSRAGATIGSGISGTKVDEAGYKGLAESADAPLKAAELAQGADDRKAKVYQYLMEKDAKARELAAKPKNKFKHMDGITDDQGNQVLYDEETGETKSLAGFRPKPKEEKDHYAVAPYMGPDGNPVVINTRTGEPKSMGAGYVASKPAQSIPGGTAKEVGEYDAAMNMASLVETRYLGGAADPGASAKQFIPASNASQYNKERRVAAQTIGTILEGGKLTDPDFGRYYDMLPDPSDSNETASKKMAMIKQLIVYKRQGALSGLKNAGFDTNKFDASNVDTASKIPPGLSGTALASPGPSPTPTPKPRIDVNKLTDDEVDEQLRQRGLLE